MESISVSSTTASSTSNPTSNANDEKQKCAICLEDLFSQQQQQQQPTKVASKQVGAVVPCGHCLHTDCFLEWGAFHRRQNMLTTCRALPKCPLCNGPADTFVPLFLDHPVTTCVSENCNSKEDCEVKGKDRERTLIKTKLKRYKPHTKQLKQQLQTERHEMEEMLVSTIQNFYKIIENHEEERQRWCKGAVELRKELDDAKESQAKERRDWTLQQEVAQRELESLEHDCRQANQRVQSATEGLNKLKIHTAKRQSKLQVALQDKRQLVQENRQLKKALLTSSSNSSIPIRSEHVYWNCA